MEFIVFIPWKYIYSYIQLQILLAGAFYDKINATNILGASLNYVSIFCSLICGLFLVFTIIHFRGNCILHVLIDLARVFFLQFCLTVLKLSVSLC